MGNNTFGALREIWLSKVSDNAKLKAYRSLVVPRVMYSAETLMATYDTNADIDIFERSCLRTILKLSWNDFTRNEDIYKKATDASGCRNQTVARIQTR